MKTASSATRIRRHTRALHLVLFITLVIAAAASLQALRKRLVPLPKADTEPVLPSTSEEQVQLRSPIEATGPLSGIVICLDPGHGYSDAGTSSELLNGLNEKDINLAVGQKLQTLLQEAGCTVLMTRQSDIPSENALVTTDGGYFLTQDARVAYANAQQPDLFLSIHCDSYEDDSSVCGIRLYYCLATEYDSAGFSGQLSSALEQATGEEVITEASGYSSAYQVNRAVLAPSVLVELGFVTNADDAAHLLDEDWQQQVAQALFHGISNYCADGAAS